MRGTLNDFPIDVEIPSVTIRHVEWGDMIVERGEARQDADPGLLFVGLPDDRCQCPHWGYVVKGRMRFRFVDREEERRQRGRCLRHAAPGHRPVLEAGWRIRRIQPGRSVGADDGGGRSQHAGHVDHSSRAEGIIIL